MKVAIGCDHQAEVIDMKNALIEVLKEKGIEFKDFGVFSTDPVDYPDIAKTVTLEVQNGNYERGILVCGTGIGMAICANKFDGIRAAVCHDLYSTQRSILSNNCNMAAFGALVTGKNTAQELLKIWLDLEFVAGRSSRKVEKISELEKL
ncbi:MAG TPA: ribose 5-phosphate isomerase B [Actinobacteria bacterium]|jgi:ribose 5-phosphate isomerase B|nr:ribose 5-phosphate isomerase B [Actinomycetota bacterium]